MATKQQRYYFGRFWRISTYLHAIHIHTWFIVIEEVNFTLFIKPSIIENKYLQKPINLPTYQPINQPISQSVSHYIFDSLMEIPGEIVVCRYEVIFAMVQVSVNDHWLSENKRIRTCLNFVDCLTYLSWKQI